MMTMRVRAVAAALPLLLVVAACGQDDGAGVRTIDEASGGGSASAPGSGSASGSASGVASEEAAPAGVDPSTANTTVDVQLREWAVEPQPAEVPGGVIAFEVTNAGGTEHEFYVARGDSLESLPRGADGSVEEAQIPPENVLPEMEPFPAGQTQTIAFEMTPGTYVLFCNIADQTGVHVAEGMYTTFTVA